MDLPDTFDARAVAQAFGDLDRPRPVGVRLVLGVRLDRGVRGRRCVATGEDVEFSSDDTAGCCSGFACGLSMGCNGGQPSAALNWMCKTGVVTGGDYTDIGKGGSCKPYEFAPCAHHVDPSPQYPACPSSEYSLKCSSRAPSRATASRTPTTRRSARRRSRCAASSRSCRRSTRRARSPSPSPSTPTFPPTRAASTSTRAGSALGGHAVEMIGWGTENGTPYWLIKNSWNDQWGDKGTFKIQARLERVRHRGRRLRRLVLGRRAGSARPTRLNVERGGITTKRNFYRNFTALFASATWPELLEERELLAVAGVHDADAERESWAACSSTASRFSKSPFSFVQNSLRSPKARPLRSADGILSHSSSLSVADAAGAAAAAAAAPAAARAPRSRRRRSRRARSAPAPRAGC